jgi:hypothetical protein
VITKGKRLSLISGPPGVVLQGQLLPGKKRLLNITAQIRMSYFSLWDTWENPDNRETCVSDFIRTNNYPFHVIDGTIKWWLRYKVEGIPTKFIIGPDQK